MNRLSTSSLKQKLEDSFIVYELYEELLNSYVSDYYLEDHWKKLPKSWQESFQGTSGLHQLSDLLDYSQPLKHRVYPLSLLSLRSFLTNTALPRKVVLNTSEINNKEFTKLLWKNVKLKKRHELTALAEICYKTAQKTNCFKVVDVGAGLGHLSRMLCYQYGFTVCTLEADKILSVTAKEMDITFERELKRKGIKHKKPCEIIHVNKRITKDMSITEFCSLVDCLGKNSQFGIIGLHPCGDLATTLLGLYNKCCDIAFINIASCCYMKLTLYPALDPGFPLSTYCKSHNFQLSYLACEIACHAIENYLIKLKNSDEYNKLKIHSYRAVLEKVLVTYKKELKHSMVSSIKYHDTLTFEEYCKKNLTKLNIEVDDHLISHGEELINQTWKDVIVFYSLRLLLAPLVESIILRDRVLFLNESRSIVDIIPAFDCNISPRNHVIVAYKNKCL